MSTRTIIEINHDELNELFENTSPFKNVLMYLRSANLQAASKEGASAGIRILGQRHHSEPEWIPSRVVCTCRTIGQASQCRYADQCHSAARPKAESIPDQETRQLAPAEQVARLKTALQFYAEPGDYKAPFTGGMGKLWHDCGATAREAISYIEGAME